MVISKTVCRDCGKAITHNTDVAHYRNTDRRRCLLTSLLVLILVTVSGVSVFILLQSVTGEGLSGIGGAERPAAFVVPDSNAPAPR